MIGRQVLPLLLAIVSSSWGVSAASVGEIWSAAALKQPDAPASSPAAHRLDAAALDRLLANASLERMRDVRRSSVVLSLPMPDGSFEGFVVEESPVMEPLLGARFPDIKTYRGQGVDDPAASVRFLRTTNGFEAQILTARGAVRIEAAGSVGSDLYRSTFWKGSPFQCAAQTDVSVRGTLSVPIRKPSVSGGSIRKYRLAVSTTADFTSLSGGTMQTAMAFVVGYVNRLNGIYERDLTVHFDLVNNNDQLISLTKPDGFTDADAGTLLNENQEKVDRVIGSANYDLGMVFAKSSQPGSGNGVAQLRSVCDPTGKARNSQRLPNTDAYWDLVAFHETAHQFGANHTFNSTLGPCAASRSVETAWEPGGGTTLMSYSSVCDNLEDRDGVYFHGGSIQEMNAFIGTAACTQATVLANTPPAVTIPSGDLFVPKGTPFTLTGAATGAGLTFCWEELDLGTASNGMPDLDDGSRPLFRSYPPSDSPTRTFPRMADVLSGTATKGESLPAAVRTMKFRVTVRDNKAGGGGVSEADTTVTVSGTAGPFTVTAPGADVSVTPGSDLTVTWTVNGTNSAPFGPSVKISLSNDGGISFPTVLAESVPNSGSATVRMPTGNVTDARIKVEGVGGSFFNVSRRFFIRVPCPAITLAPTTIPDAIAQVNLGPITLTASGGTGPYTYAVAAGTLPWPLTLSADGVLTGPPQETGSISFTVTVTDASGCTGTVAYTFKVTPFVSIGDSGVMVGEGAPGRHALALVPLSFPVSLTAPSPFPVTIHYQTMDESAHAGQSYTAASGTVTFAPGETNRVITVMVNDTRNGSIEESFAVVLSQPVGAAIDDGVAEGEILEPEAGTCPPLIVTPASLPGGRRGVLYSQAVSATGGAALKKVVLMSGELPPGLALNAATGIVSGISRAAGTFTFEVEAIDVNNCYASKTFRLGIDSPAPTITSFSPVSGPVGTLVTINGSGLLDATRVAFGSAGTGSFPLTSDTSIRVSVPVGATAGPIAVSTPGGTGSSQSNFLIVKTAPLALNATLTTAPRTTAKGRLAASEVNGLSLLYAISPTEKPGHGTALVTDASTGDFTYTPENGFTGTDRFFFTASDGSAVSNVATVTVTVFDSTKLDLFVPVVLSSGGANGAFFTSELTLTNRGTTPATVTFAYTAATGGGSGTGTDTIPPLGQKIVADAISYLRSLGVPIPGDGSRVGTLRVAFSGLSAANAAGVTLRTSTPVPPDAPTGRAGLAYSGIPTGRLLGGPVVLCGLLQNDQDRTNVAIQNAGVSDDGPVTLKLTYFPGDGSAPAGLSPVEETLLPGGFKQYRLADLAPTATAGYVRVERIAGSAPYFAYGVVNDQANSDGSFINPLPLSALSGRKGFVLPVAVETSAYATELALTNFSTSARQVAVRFVAAGLTSPDQTASFAVSLAAGEQKIIPSFVQYLRDRHVAGVPPAGPTLAGSVFVTPVSGDVNGIFVSARTSNPGSRGRYGLFYGARPFDSRYAREAWIHGLQQNLENRSNLAMINVGDVDQADITLKVTLYDGATGNVAKVIEGETTRLASGQFRQIGAILSEAPGTAQGWAHIEQTGGANAFVVYGVVNDGGTPGARSGDGAFLEMDTPVVFDLPQRGGTWTDTTRGKSGPATGSFRQNTLDQRIDFTFDMNETTASLGVELPPLTFSGTYSPGGEMRFSGVSGTWGPYSVTIKSSGEIVGALPEIPIPSLTRLDFTGFQTPTATDLDTLFTLRTGSKISGRLHLEGGSLGTR